MFSRFVARVGPAGDFEAGVGQAIDAVDALLVRHFPFASGLADSNELPDAPLLR